MALLNVVVICANRIVLQTVNNMKTGILETKSFGVYVSILWENEFKTDAVRFYNLLKSIEAVHPLSTNLNGYILGFFSALTALFHHKDSRGYATANPLAFMYIRVFP